MRRALIIGQGSIGQRHNRILTEMGFEVFTVSRHLTSGERNFAVAEEAVAAHIYDYIVIASPTSQHHDHIRILSERAVTCPVLVEKPLFETSKEIPKVPQAAVGYTLRFHPVWISVSDDLQNAPRIQSAQFIVAQNLAQWRNRDCKTSSSASRASGGGVLRDLSHEIDLAAWLLGPVRRVFAHFDRYSDLTLDTEDTATLVLETERCKHVTIHMNATDHLGQRRASFNLGNDTIAVDLLKGEVRRREGEQLIKVERDQIYRSMHEAFLSGDRSRICSLDEGLAVCHVIDAAEKSAFRGVWEEL